jgi:hypothetical protein
MIYVDRIDFRNLDNPNLIFIADFHSYKCCENVLKMDAAK